MQLFGQEIINLRKKEQMEHKNNKMDSNRRYVIILFLKSVSVIKLMARCRSTDQTHLTTRKKMLILIF